MQSTFAVRALLFDLDGTLLDTANDLITALHSLTDARQLSSTKPTYHAIRAAAGRGCKGLLKTGLDIDENNPDYAELAEQLLTHYQNHLLETTHLFPGMGEVLDYLDEIHIPWGIVTNKPHRYTQQILEGLHITQRAKCIVSGDSLEKRKPHPQPILHACELLQTSPQNCIYVGDSEIDVIASQAAGARAIAALYGYIAETENPQDWNADGYIQQPKDLLEWLN